MASIQSVHPGAGAEPPFAAGRPLWVVVLAAGLIVAVTVGLRQVMGLYLPPVTQELGIGREPFSTAMAIANLVIGIGSIPAGAIADKYGAGRVVVAGVLLTMAGNYILYAAHSGDALMWSGVFLGLGTASAGINALVGAVARAAGAEKRTAAIAAVGMAGGIGNFAAFPYTHALMEVFGWRGSLLAAAATLALLLPVAWFVSGRPQAQSGRKAQSLGEAFHEAVRWPSYWLLVIGYSVCGFHVAFYSVHLPAFIADKGLPAWVGVWALTAVGIANIVGTFFAGQLAGVIGQRAGLIVIYATRCFIFLGMLYLPINPLTVIMLSATLGLVWLSTIPLTSGLVGTFFGTTWMSMLFGVVLFSHQLGSFAGLWVAGRVFDMTKSYDLMWWISIGLAAIAVLIHWPIRERPVPRLEGVASAGRRG